MAQVSKRKLTGSTNGRGIKVAATATPGTLLHTAVAGTTDGTYDEVWLYAYNSDTSDRLLTIELGGTSSPDDHIKVTVPSQSGRLCVLDGHPLQNAVVVRAFAAAANAIVITGFVNAITA